MLVFLAVLAAAIYLLVRVTDRRSRASRPTRKSLGPDDDPEFLRWLNQKRKRDQ